MTVRLNQIIHLRLTLSGRSHYSLLMDFHIIKIDSGYYEPFLYDDYSVTMSGLINAVVSPSQKTLYLPKSTTGSFFY